jgi:hypothetical protein
VAALDGYELANDSIKRFRAEFPSGRVIPVLLDWDLIKGYVLYRCDVYREYEDVYPSASSTAYGNVEFYPQHMKRWFIEDTETSAITRAIKLLTPSAERPSREDMEKVEYAKDVTADPWSAKASIEGIPTMATAIADIQTGLGGTLPAEPARCKHGTMVWAEGTSAKTGKAWAAYKCTERVRANQCDPIWQVLDSLGKWKPQQ